MKKNKEERKQFFEELYQKCSQEGVYSVIETAKKMGVSYDLVDDWAQKSQSLDRILQKCRASCLKNINNTYAATSSLPQNWQELERARIENDDEELAKHIEWVEKERLEKEEQQRKEKNLADQAKEIRKGISLPLASSDRSPRPNTTQDNDDKDLPVSSKNELTQWLEQRNTAEQDRLKSWREKQAKENAGYWVEKNNEKSTDDTIYLGVKYDKANLTSGEQEDITRSAICAATGVASYPAGITVLTSAIGAIHKKEWLDAAHATNATQDALLAMKPNDLFEGMLCSRLWVLQNQAMEFLRRVAHPDSPEASVDLNINRATKLMRLQNETLEVLNKHRRKGEQKVTVQHVNVNDGGQAIVNGQFTPGGGDKNKNSESEPHAN